MDAIDAYSVYFAIIMLAIEASIQAVLRTNSTRYPIHISRLPSDLAFQNRKKKKKKCMLRKQQGKAATMLRLEYG
jgi:hypothetical protein